MSDICNIPKNTMTNYAEAFPGSVTSTVCTNQMQQISAQGDQVVMDNTIKSFIEEKGYPVLYYPYLFEIEKAEHLHGEHSAAGYGVPFKMYAYMTIEEQPSWFAMQGIDSDTTATIFIHIKTWREQIKTFLQDPTCEQYEDYSKIYNLNYIEEKDIVHAIEPKVKDLIQLTTFGCDREFDRGNKIFEITNKEDETFSDNMNVAGGHYVWKITAKRYRYSFEEGMSTLDKKSANNQYLGEAGEKGNHYVSENKSVFKMFLEDEGLTSEDLKDITTEDNKGMGAVEGIRVVKNEQQKVYSYDNIEESKKNFDLDKRIDGVYDDVSGAILSNDLF